MNHFYNKTQIYLLFKLKFIPVYRYFFIKNTTTTTDCSPLIKKLKLKLKLFNDEIHKVWMEISGNLTDLSALAEYIENYKKITNFFQVGDFYTLIFNLSFLDLEYVSQDVTNLLGYSPNEFNMALFMEIMHPDDRPWCLAFEKKTLEFLLNLPVSKLVKYKVRYDVRLKDIKGEYKRILHQSAVVDHDSDGKIIRTFCVHTDITHFKTEGLPKLSFIGMDGEKSYIDLDVEQPIKTSNEFLSKREKEILLHIIEGKASKEIADILCITLQTVESHRKNMINRNNLKNTAELIAVSIRRGWV